MPTRRSVVAPEPGSVPESGFGLVDLLEQPERPLVDRWIDKGAISHLVRNLRLNQSVLAMLSPWNVEAIGVPQRLSPLIVSALKLGAFTFTSVSDAI